MSRRAADNGSFTGQNQMFIAGPWDFPFREYARNEGRWLSPDPADLAAVNPANPRSWNAYAYVANQPLEFTDPLGLGSGCGPIPGTEPPPNAVYSCPGGWVGVPFTFYTQGVAYPTVPPMWEMGCDAGCISGILAAQAAGLLSLADNFASGLGGYSNAPGPSGSAGISAGTTKIGSSLLQCTADHAADWSLAGALGHIPGLNHGIGGFIVNMLGGNTFSAATDLATSVVTGQAGGHSVFYHMGLSVAAGPAQGFKPVLDALGMSVDNARGLLEGGLTAAAGEWATGIGEAKFGLDLATFIGAGAACVAGFVR